MNNLAWRQMSLFIVRKRTLLQRKLKPSFFWAAVFARGFLGIKCHIFEVLSSSSSQWTSFLFKKCVYQLCFLCFLLFHEAQRGLMVSWERRLAFLLDENVHRYITFGQASIILKFNRKKLKTNSEIGQSTTNSSQNQRLAKLDVCLRARDRWNRRRWWMPKMEHHKILSFLDNLHSPSLVVLAMQNWKLPRLIQKEKKAMFNCYPFAFHYL